MPKIDIPDGKSDPEVRVWALRPEMGMAAGAMSHAIYEQSILPVRERELARMRIAQINDCAICRQWRKTTGAAEAMTEADYAAVEQWATHPGYTERERLAIEYADKFALDHHALDDAFFARLRGGLHRRRDPRPHRVRRRLARDGTHPARARHRRVLPHRMGDLALDTAVEGGDGRYTATMSRDWEIWGPNGGYVASCALRAAGVHSRFDRPASIVGHYLGVADFDTVDIEVTTLRAAKRAESLRVSMTQGGQPIFEALVWAVGDVTGLEHDMTSLPDTRDPETVPSVAERLASTRPAFLVSVLGQPRPTGARLDRRLRGTRSAPTVGSRLRQLVPLPADRRHSPTCGSMPVAR